jgi:small redox-active disulfide protein 1
MVVTLELFTSKTCPHCPAAKEVAAKVKEKIGDDLDYQDLDVDENMEKAMEYGIMAVPTLVIDGEVAFTGAPRTKELYQAIMNKL